MDVPRSHFLAAVGGSLLRPDIGVPNGPVPTLRAAVLSGGGALGAFEAGYLDARGLGYYDILCGTSAGALNAVLYSMGYNLTSVWNGIAGSTVVAPQARYRHLFKTPYVIGSIAAEVGRFVNDVLSGNGHGFLCATDPIEQYFFDRLNDGNGNVRPFGAPVFWTSTDLVSQVPTVFYKFAEQTHASIPTALDVLSARADSNVRREFTYRSVDTANAKEFAHLLRASTAIPFVFEPVIDGGELYVDGGLTVNVPTGILRSLLRYVNLIIDIIEVDPPAGRVSAGDLAKADKFVGRMFNFLSNRLIDVGVLEVMREANRIVTADPKRGSVDNVARTYLVQPASTLVSTTLGFDSIEDIKNNIALGAQAKAAPVTYDYL